MSNRKTFWIVLISIVAVLVIAAGGYALYRWGYARGVAIELPEFMDRPFMVQRAGGEDLEFGEPIMPWGRHTGMHGIGLRGYAMPHFWWGGGFFALLIGGGVLALAVYGLIVLLRRDGTSTEVVASKKK